MRQSWRRTWRRDVAGALGLLGAATALGLVVNLFHPRAVSFGEQKPPPEVSPPGSWEKGGLRFISADTLKEWLATGKCVALDARDPEAYRQSHIPGARNLPVDFLEGFLATVQRLPKDRWLVCYCDGPPCDLGERLALELRSWGFERVAVYWGGMADWRKRGEPVAADGGER